MVSVQKSRVKRLAIFFPKPAVVCLRPPLAFGRVAIKGDVGQTLKQQVKSYPNPPPPQGPAPSFCEEFPWNRPNSDVKFNEISSSNVAAAIRVAVERALINGADSRIKGFDGALSQAR